MEALTKKTYQRINRETGRWIESVEVAPTPIENADGTFSLGYSLTEDLIEAEPPIDLGMVWTVNGWALEPIQIPPMPEPIQRWLVDENGFFVDHVLIHPVLHENNWVYLGIENPYLIAEGPDPTIPIYKHHWDGLKWGEGATKEEIKKMHSHIPNWAGFLTAYLLSDIDDLILQTSDSTALQKFNRFIPMMPNDELLPSIVACWNACIDGLPEPLPESAVEGIALFVEKYEIPLTTEADGKFAIANINGN